MSAAQTCQACGHVGYPYQELAVSGGLVNKCSNQECGAVLAAPPRNEPAKVAQVYDLPVQRAPTRSRVQEGESILDLAKSRLAAIRERIAELRALEREEAQLARMIAAAETE